MEREDGDRQTEAEKVHGMESQISAAASENQQHA